MIETFEDMEVWQVSRQLVKDIYVITAAKAFGRAYALRDQIRRAAISINSNIAEGFDRGSNKEFAQFLAMSKGSAAEVRSQLYLALDLGYIEVEKFASLKGQLLKLSRQLSAFRRYLQDHPRKER